MLLGTKDQDGPLTMACFYSSTSVSDGIYLTLWNIYS